MFVFNMLWQNNCPKASFYNRIREGEYKWVREAAASTGRQVWRETKEKVPKHFAEAALPAMGQTRKVREPTRSLAECIAFLCPELSDFD